MSTSFAEAICVGVASFICFIHFTINGPKRHKQKIFVTPCGSPHDLN